MPVTIRAWLYGGPFDGEMVTLTTWGMIDTLHLWHNGWLCRYEHRGPPDEPDVHDDGHGNTGVRLEYVPEGAKED
jgi:hypothetical protein